MKNDGLLNKVLVTLFMSFIFYILLNFIAGICYKYIYVNHNIDNIVEENKNIKIELQEIKSKLYCYDEMWLIHDNNISELYKLNK